jgi:hypothetical protein
MSNITPSNGEVEGPHRSARWRRGRTISQRPRRQPTSASRSPPTIVRAHAQTLADPIPEITEHLREVFGLKFVSAAGH